MLATAKAYATHLITPRGDDLLPDSDAEVFQERRNPHQLAQRSIVPRVREDPA
jgi:hypothetical protein